MHNLLAWQQHLQKLFAMKAAGGCAMSASRPPKDGGIAELEQLMRTQPIDFVQLSYNPLDRDAEQRLLPLAASAASR